MHVIRADVPHLVHGLAFCFQFSGDSTNVF